MIFCCKRNKVRLHLIYVIFIAFTTKFQAEELIMKEILREIGMIAKALDLKNRDKEWEFVKKGNKRNY